jgi:hypothetical protein
MITRNMRLLVFHGDRQGPRDAEPEGFLAVLVDGTGAKLELPLRSWAEVDEIFNGASIPMTIGPVAQA